MLDIRSSFTSFLFSFLYKENYKYVYCILSKELHCSHAFPCISYNPSVRKCAWLFPPLISWKWYRDNRSEIGMPREKATYAELDKLCVANHVMLPHFNSSALYRRIEYAITLRRAQWESEDFAWPRPVPYSFLELGVVLWKRPHRPLCMSIFVKWQDNDKSPFAVPNVLYLRHCSLFLLPLSLFRKTFPCDLKVTEPLYNLDISVFIMR
jgi:hypothetical protein